MFGASPLAGRRAHRTGSAIPYSWRESAVASSGRDAWRGHRGHRVGATGQVTGGGAFPAREVVVLVALLVVLVTLVAQGLTLAPLITPWGRDRCRRPSRRPTIVEKSQAGLKHLRHVDGVDPDVRTAVLEQYESRLRYRRQVQGLVDGNLGGDDADTQLRDLLAEATEAERETVLKARRTGDVHTAAADEVMFDVEARALRYRS